MKIFAQVIFVEPLALIVSLPNQLLAHIPITNITSQFTHLLESMDDEGDETPSDDSDDEAGPSGKPRVPDLFELFHPGQYVRAIVTAVHAQGSTDVAGFSRTRDESLKGSRRVELSLFPEKVNEGVAKQDVKVGYVSPTLQSLLSAFSWSSGMLSCYQKCRRPRIHPGPGYTGYFRLLVLQRCRTHFTNQWRTTIYRVPLGYQRYKTGQQ